MKFFCFRHSGFLSTQENLSTFPMQDEPLLPPGKIGTDGAHTFPSTIKAPIDDGLLHPKPVHYVTRASPARH
ncbi:hypothetical protein REMIM1_PE00473 (plasmid) [Rhizobium etli bv. mimosae str. Mim1]|nr:hypothetical protein REMIM1_PE00473 [Rhizobium etli bv. mimosae str. Mim1]